MNLRIGVLVLTLAAVAAAQQQPAPLNVIPLKGGVYAVQGGSGANTGFIVGQKEVIAVDAKMTEDSTRSVVAEIARVTPNPIKYIILTHGDLDHVNGLAGFPKGLTILAHSTTKRDMEEAFKDPQLNALRACLPNQVLETSRTLTLDSVQVQLLYFGPAHTSGDLVVFLPQQKIAFVGDLVFVGRDPLVHRQKGGDSAGLVQVLQKLLALDADTFLTGHSNPLTKADVKAALTSLEEKRAKVEALVRDGKSLEEVKSAMGVTAGGGRFPSLVENIYLEMTAKK